MQSLRPSAPARGVALLMVITVLVTLVLLALPFSMSMRQGRERTTSERARSRALGEARLLADALKLLLGGTHPMVEEERRLNGGQGVDADPAVDSLEEITPGPAFRDQWADAWEEALASDPLQRGRLRLLSQRGLGPMNDDRGSIWTGVVADANAKVNPNGASPYLLGNLMGAALLADDIDASDTEIEVDHIVADQTDALEGFPPDGGWLRIGGETIRYGRLQGTTFRNCLRGQLPDVPLGDNGAPRSHEKGTPVIAYEAWLLATHRIAARPGYLTAFRNLEDLRTVASWCPEAGLTAARLARLRAFFTVWSRRETAEWLAPQLVVNALPSVGEGGGYEEVELRDLQNPTGDTAYYNPGTLVRITDGVQTAYQMVIAVGEPGGGQVHRLLTLSGPVDAGREDGSVSFTGGRATITACAPFPVNVNTAPREVIYACMANLHIRDVDDPDGVVDPERAWEIAGIIVDTRGGSPEVDPDTGRRVGGPFRRLEDFGQLLEQLEESERINRVQREALYYNAVNPHDALLAFGTAPFCFRTLDVYHLEARVAVSDGAGDLAAAATVWEVVEIGSDGKTEWVLDSQSDFEELLGMGSGAKWVATFPFGVNFRGGEHGVDYRSVQPARRAPKAVRSGVYPLWKRNEGLDDRGDVRLEPARIHLPGNTFHSLAEHFDGAPFTEGWRTDYNLAYRQRVPGVLWNPRRDDYPQPFTLSFWWCPYSDAEWTAWDCGMEKFQNRFAIFVMQGDQGPELVFRACSAALEGRGAELFVPLRRLDYRPGNWYHIHVSCRGEDPTTMEMLVDGVAVAERRGFTWLTTDLTESQEEVLVESTAGFPPVGALLVGTEVVEYETRSPDGFRDTYRGARGTHGTDAEPGTGRTWPAGTPVRELGYSATLLQDVMRGGSTLPTDLGRWSAVWVANQVDQTNYVDGNTTWTYYGVGPDTQSFTAQIEPLWAESAEDAAEAFGTSGLAILGSEQPHGSDALSADGHLLGGWEIVSYTRNEGDGTSIQIEQRWLARAGRAAPEAYFLCVRREGMTVTENDDGSTTETSEPAVLMRAHLIPISVQGTSTGGAGDDYLDPLDPLHEDILRRHAMDWNGDAILDEGDGAGRVLLGLPTDDEPPEVVRYDALDRTIAATGDLLFVADRDMVPQLVREFFTITPEESGQTVIEIVIEGILEEEFLVEEEGSVATQEVTPPSDAILPEEDPVPDHSGAGEPENPTEDDFFPEDVIPATHDPQAYQPDQPDAQNGDATLWPWPAWGRVKTYVRRYFRGANGTTDRRHESGNEVQRETTYMPCFRAYEGPAHAGVPSEENDLVSGQPLIHRGARPLGRNDRVTITDGEEDSPLRLPALVRWADPYSRWAALDSFLETRIAAPRDEREDQEEGDSDLPNLFGDDRRGLPRLLKHPTGELPDEMPEWMEFARSEVSRSDVVTAYLDELDVWRHPVIQEPLAFVESAEGVSEDATEIRLLLVGELEDKDLTAGYHPECGLLGLDGEVILWRGSRFESDDVLVLEQCERGMLGTRARPHPRGGYGHLLTDLAVTYLEAEFPRDAASIPVARLSRAWPGEGLVRILRPESAELVHFTRRTQQDLLLPEALDADEDVRGRGLLRGRFGTDATDHEQGEPVLFQPFRYWDRYIPRRTEEREAFSGVHDHPEGSYLEVGRRIRSGYWHQLTWMEGVGGSDDAGEDLGRGRGSLLRFLDVVVLARFSPQVPWDSRRIVDLRGTEGFGRDAAADDRPLDAIYVFDDPEAPNRLAVEAETIEVRVFFVYRPGAFVPQDLALGSTALDDLVFENDWKRTPALLDLRVEYTNRTTTHARSVAR